MCCLTSQVPAKVLEQVLAHGRLLMYRSGRQIHESAPVRAVLQAWSCLHEAVCCARMTSSVTCTNAGGMAASSCF